MDGGLARNAGVPMTTINLAYATVNTPTRGHLQLGSDRRRHQQESSTAWRPDGRADAGAGPSGTWLHETQMHVLFAAHGRTVVKAWPGAG